MTDELKQWDYDRGYDKGKADMLEIIEDIKAELTKSYVDNKPSNFRYTRVMLKDVLEIINKHIGEENE